MINWRRLARTDATGQLIARSVARSHVGRVRQINEDRVFNDPERRLWAVADGMGGHGGGDLAAQSIVDAFRSITETDIATTAPGMFTAIHAANDAIIGRNESQLTNAASTVVAAHLDGRTATIAWAGDSRAYLNRDGRLSLLTHDHSVVQDLIDAGLLTPERAHLHPHANVVTRGLGVSRELNVAEVTLELCGGDRLLLCSDGLSRSLEADDLEVRELDALADALLSCSLKRDGTDNTSFILVELRV
ncbi:MAG: protein phosphatase 2C domain-containing protein [Candidatus Eremiobacteraeota bacterium]|nr:protein phosphatase 2C domain-containing protein [Candidatus Eremiobacteraeota bacterium]